LRQRETNGRMSDDSETDFEDSEIAVRRPTGRRGWEDLLVAATS